MSSVSHPWMAQDKQGVTVRPIQAHDVGLIDAMHGRLSPDSLYDRYQQPRSPTQGEIAAVCRMSPEKGAGFVATVPQQGDRIVGLAYYLREAQAQQPTAEPGILIEDQLQGQGIGRTLWQQMHYHAQANQIRCLRVWFHTVEW